MKRPPIIPEWILKRVLSFDEYSEKSGDFDEVFSLMIEDEGRFKAALWYSVQVLKTLPLVISLLINRSIIMFKSYLKIALRNIQRNKVYSFLNVFSLSIGISASMLIMLFIQDEVSFDGFHENGNNIYRIYNKVVFDGQDPQEHAVTPGLLAQALRTDFPEVIQSAKLWNWKRKLMRTEDRKMNIDQVIAADEGFFDLFSFNLLQGDRSSALSSPQSIVLTQETALKLFGTEDVIGKTVTDWNNNEHKVTGLIENPPDNSHIQFDVITSWPATGFLNRWITHAVNTYVQLHENADPEMLEAKLPELIATNLGNRVDNYTYLLQPLKNVHLYSSNILYDFNWRKGNINYFYIFPFIAFMILGIACINFMNLATARASKRAREVGLRKVVGAHRKQLVNQFLGESVTISVFALLLAFVLVNLFIPVFNSITGKALSLEFVDNAVVLLLSLTLAVVVGLLAGSYPALYLSAFNPLKVLKGVFKSMQSRDMVRYGLVTLQFTASITLIASTVIVFNQVDYMKNKNLGFNKDQVLVVPIRDRSVVPKYELFKNELMSHNGIIDVGATTHVMGMSLSTYHVLPEGIPQDEAWSAPVVSVDHNFIPAMGIEIIEGRNFSKEFPTDILGAVIVNETFVEKAGWDEPIGKLVAHGEIRGRARVIGVAKDFHMQSLHQEVAPIVIYMDSQRLDHITVRMKAGSIVETIEFIEDRWSSFNPVHPFEFSFLDQDLNQSYDNDQKVGKVFGYLSGLAILISCLGLFGLASFTAEQRTKEIGIRKVLGASVSRISVMLSQDFIKFTTASNIIAWPLAYYFMDQWLQNFAYRIDIGLNVFLVAGMATLIISVVTVSFQILKSAISNPVTSLRYE